MDKLTDYFYYILKKPYDNQLMKVRDLPAIYRILNYPNGVFMKLIDPFEGEGPFESLHELKNKSLIFREIKLQKHRDRVSKNQNIKTIKEGLLTKIGTSFEKTFFDSFSHIVVGKISKKKLTGVHFYDPDKIQIIEKIKSNNKTGVWSARIKKQNENTGEWIEKDEISNFFPEKWSVARTFEECNFAYHNKVFDSGKTHYSKTRSGIKVIFIIDQENKVITFYPELD
jgi:Bacterial EndoU nuclease